MEARKEVKNMNERKEKWKWMDKGWIKLRRDWLKLERVVNEDGRTMWAKGRKKREEVQRKGFFLMKFNERKYKPFIFHLSNEIRTCIIKPTRTRRISITSQTLPKCKLNRQILSHSIMFFSWQVKQPWVMFYYSFCYFFKALFGSQV